MKTLAFMTLVLAALFAGVGRASAEVDYPWCLIAGGKSDGTYSCGYVSFAQCMATRIGTDMCVQNPMYVPPGVRAQRERGRRSQQPR